MLILTSLIRHSLTYLTLDVMFHRQFSPSLQSISMFVMEIVPRQFIALIEVAQLLCILNASEGMFALCLSPVHVLNGLLPITHSPIFSSNTQGSTPSTLSLCAPSLPSTTASVGLSYVDGASALITSVSITLAVSQTITTTTTSGVSTAPSLLATSKPRRSQLQLLK